MTTKTITITAARKPYASDTVEESFLRDLDVAVDGKPVVMSHGHPGVTVSVERDPVNGGWMVSGDSIDCWLEESVGLRIEETIGREISAEADRRLILALSGVARVGGTQTVTVDEDGDAVLA